MTTPKPQGGIIKFALWELAAFFKYFARVSVNCGASKQSKWTQLTGSVHNNLVSYLIISSSNTFISIHILSKSGTPTKYFGWGWRFRGNRFPGSLSLSHPAHRAHLRHLVKYSIHNIGTRTLILLDIKTLIVCNWQERVLTLYFSLQLTK